MVLAHSRIVSHSLNPFRLHVFAILMQRQARRAPARVGLECHLRIHDLQKELVRALGIELKLRLARRLRKEPIPFAGDGQDELRRELELAHVSIEELGVHGKLFVLLGRCEQRYRESSRCIPMSSTPAAVKVFDNTTTPTRVLVLSPTKDRYP